MTPTGSHDEQADAAEEQAAVKLVDLILSDAIRRGASDIHIEPDEKECRVSYRIDGVLQTTMALPLKLKGAISRRVRNLAKLPASEERPAQDGRATVSYEKQGRAKAMDVSVSVVPTVFGEKIFLRLTTSDERR